MVIFKKENHYRSQTIQNWWNDTGFTMIYYSPPPPPHSMLVMSTSLVNDVNDVMEEYEAQINIEWGEWGEEKSLY